MKYLMLLAILSSCNALTLFNNQKSKIDENFKNDYGNNNQSTSLACPASYSKVAANAVFGTNEFCVMRFEAKDIGSVATSTDTLTPWTTGISLISAKSNCQALGTGFDLISNPEWMTIAAEIETNGNNWSSGTVGSGCIFRGNTGAASACEYDGANPEFGSSSGRDIKAKHFLQNGEEIWDLSGNVQEWVDWTIGGAHGLGPTDCAATDVELNALAACGLIPINYQSQNGGYTSTQGVGRIYGGTSGAALRGGTFINIATAGIYRLALNALSTATGGFGFRCVYRGTP